MKENEYDFYGNPISGEESVGQNQENAGNYVGGIVGNNVEEKANSIGMTLENPGFTGFQGGVFGNTENVSEAESQNGYVGGFVSSSKSEKTGLPAKVSLWSKIKSFLFQEIDLHQEVTIKLTPKEEKVLTEVHDFLFQEISWKGVKDFLFQDITFGKKKKNG
ncbi:MAG: hypothetical protein IKF52_07220 [Clostridia bacterium]|nr:hypothetical protein [Clostridia bacterium]